MRCNSCGSAAIVFPDFSAWACCNTGACAAASGCTRCGRLCGLCGFLGLC